MFSHISSQGSLQIMSNMLFYFFLLFPFYFLVYVSFSSLITSSFFEPVRLFFSAENKLNLILPFLFWGIK